MIPLEAERAAPFVVPGARVLDIGASTGTFTRWAVERGAFVTAVEPYPPNVKALRDEFGENNQVQVLACAAGPSGQRGRYIEPEDEAARATGLMVIADPNGTERLDPLHVLLDVGGTSVVKCDIQGAEYALFADADDATLQRCRFISIERHGWTTPSEEPVEGWGVLDGPPMPEAAYEKIVERMERTHRVEVDADLLYCYLR